MRIMVFVLASALAVCFMGPASAATKRSAAVANPDKSAARQSENSEEALSPLGLSPSSRPGGYDRWDVPDF